MTGCNTQRVDLYLSLDSGCAPAPMATSVQSVPYTMIATAELDQLRAENEQLKQRIAELEPIAEQWESLQQHCMEVM